MKNYILIKDNVLNFDECNEIISMFDKNVTTDKFSKVRGYSHFEIDVNKFKFTKKIYDAVIEYQKKFEEINKTASMWALSKLRYKKFLNGNSFSDWHSEHNITYSTRVLSLQVYLTENNCGTEFYNKEYETIMSRIGRVAVFPAYFTHTHRGQSCPDKKDRSIITGYINFVKAGINE